MPLFDPIQTRTFACVNCGRTVTAMIGMASDRESVCGLRCLVAIEDRRLAMMGRNID